MSISSDTVSIVAMFSTPSDVVNFFATNKEFKKIDNDYTWNYFLNRDFGFKNVKHPKKLYIHYYKLSNEIKQRWKSPHSTKKMFQFMNYVLKNLSIIYKNKLHEAKIFTLEAMITFMKGLNCDINLLKHLLSYEVTNNGLRELLENNMLIDDITSYNYFVNIIPYLNEFTMKIDVDFQNEIYNNVQRYNLERPMESFEDFEFFGKHFKQVKTPEQLEKKMMDILDQPVIVLYLNHDNELDYTYVNYNIDELQLYFSIADNDDYPFHNKKLIFNNFGRLFYKLKRLMLSHILKQMIVDVMKRDIK